MKMSEKKKGRVRERGECINTDIHLEKDIDRYRKSVS
jgi:hypothetical protein